MNQKKLRHRSHPADAGSSVLDTAKTALRPSNQRNDKQVKARSLEEQQRRLEEQQLLLMMSTILLMIPTDLARTKVGYRDDEVALVIRLVFSRYGGDSCNLMIPLRDCSNKASSISIIQLQYYGTVVRRSH